MGYENLLDAEVLDPVVLKLALAMQTQAAALCKVDTGNLRNSISVSMRGFYKSQGSSNDQISIPSGPGVAHIGSAVSYAAAKEYGLPERPGYPADPYLRPAFDIVRAQTGRLGGEELRRRLEAYANRFPHKTKVLGGEP